MKLISMLSFVWMLFSCCFGVYANDEKPKSGSQVSSFESVPASIGVTGKKISGFYHFIQMAMPDRSFHADCRIFFSGDLSSEKAIRVRATTLNSKELKFVNGTLVFNGYKKFVKNLPAEQSFTLI